MKTFCSAEDIENLATQGKTELIIDESTVLTDLARHTADQLGITIVHRSGSAPESTPDVNLVSDAPFVSGSVPVQPSQVLRSVSVNKLGSKPKGCQHGPLNTQQQPSVEATSSNSSSGTVVDQLVGLVKRLGRNES